MKICFITFEYPPLEIGGAGVYALHITRELAKLGHEVHVISRSINGREMHSIENDVLVHRIPTICRRFLNAPSFWFNLARKYSKISKDAGGFDILHGNDVDDLSLFKWRTKEPRVVTIHHLAYLVAKTTSPLKRLFGISGEVGFTPLIQKIVISRADKIIAVSNFTKKTLVSTYRVPPSKIEVIPHGINVNEYLFSKDDIIKYRRSIGLDDHFAFLFVGRLEDPRKNLSTLLKALKIMDKKTRKSVKLVLAGAGDPLKVKKSADSLDIGENIIPLGYVHANALKKCYSACDVFVSPSLLEGFGLTILEAMAAAKPVIALKRGAVSELIEDGVNGLLVKKNDPRELAAVMTFFVDHPDAIVAMGVANKYKISKGFSWQKSARLTELAYESVMNLRSNLLKPGNR
jgi:glycosyltransferase involved in cell wall biosynthesis